MVQDWPRALGTEPEDSLKALGRRLTQDITAGSAADEERMSVAGERATHRARNIASLIDDLNALRATTLGRLVVRGTKNKLPPDWPRRFFYKSRTAPAKSGPPTT